MVQVPAGGQRTATPGPSAARFLTILHGLIGDRYTWGGNSPATGFDCSGLVQYAATKAGVKNFPRTSEQQYAATKRITFAELRPGDLIFEQWPGDQAAPGHVAIYTGTGKIEEAPQPGQPVHVVPWSPGSVSAAGGRIVGYGRIPGMSGATAAQLTAAQGSSGSSGLLGLPGEVVTAFSEAGTALDWLLQPSHWVRIFAGIGGGISVASGVWMLTHVGGDTSMAGQSFPTVPRPAALPVGIALVGVGGVLLFVAFHNLPATVIDLPTLLGYLVASMRGNTAGTSAASGTAPATGVTAA